MVENDVSFAVRGAIFTVYNTLGPGLLETVYEAALAFQLEQYGMFVRTQVPVPVVFGDVKLELGFRLDILVNDLVIIEIKSVEHLAEVHHKQVLTYLRLTGKRLGILVNFNTDNIAASIYRKVNNLTE
ncbi:MAG: GxxExxY protein [Bacteroidetes bacterium]|nr:MAG: GxxExxY protein [Bacteroidota bacterium]